MSDLLINWLNDEVQLSRRITNFEEDFHNGYLFGELLNKYSQQLNFNDFVNKDDKNSRIKNFTLLYDTFKTLRVGFDSNIAMNIIEKKTGIAKKVLYELKMQLQKTNSNAFSKMGKSSKPLSPLKKIPLSKDTFDKISKEHFNKQLNQIHRAQKNINLDSHLQKFPDFHQKQLERADMEERKEAQSTLLKQMKFRERQLDNLKKSEQFRHDWQQSNLQKWAANVSIRKLQNQKDFSYRNKLENTKIQNKTMAQLNAIKSLDDDIKKFEKVLPKKSKDESDSDEEPQGQLPPPQQPKLLKRSTSNLRGSETSGLNRTFDNRSQMQGTQTMSKKAPQELELNRHQREKRRRKMIVEQGKKHHLIKIERRQKYILNTLEQNSKQQKQIQYEIWRAWQNKEIIIQNRQAYDEKIKEKQETRTINAKFKDDELVKTFREQHQQELKNSINRQNKLKTDNSVRQRKQVYSQCKNIVESFISMTEVLFQFGQQKNVQQIDQIFLNHLLDEFVESASNKKEIAEIQLKNYIQGKGQWNIQLTKDSQEQSTQPTEENSLPMTVVNNYYLGNILKTVFNELYSENKVEESTDKKCQNLVALLGLEFAGKKELAHQIKDQYGFNVICIEDLIQGKLSDFNTMQQKGIQIDGQTADLVQACYSGKPIPNNIIISLLKAQTQKHQKCLIVNYPITYEESVEFTQSFGNVAPSDYLKKGKLVSKIQDFSRLVWPTQTKYIPRSLKPCGIDFALWVDISPRTSLDRFLGRRWTPEGQCVHINHQIANPNVLTVGQKASPAILKNSFKINNKNKIRDWFSQFGISVNDNGEEHIQLCWQQISGEGSVEVVSQNVFTFFNKALEIKNKKNTQIKLAKKNQENEAKKKEEKQKFEEELKQKCALSTPEQIQQKFQEALDSVKINQNFLQNVEQIWNSTQKMTISSFCNIFQILRDQDQSKNKYISNTKRNFIRLLTREDQRFYLVKKFQNQYNKFFQQNQDMVSQQYTKEELHQRIQDLETDLLTLIQDKKQDAVNERQSIMNSGWLESQLEQIVGAAHVLLQTELNRSFACQQIICDFYSKKYMVSTGQIQEGQQELPIDSSLELYKDGTSPRLEKLVSQAMRLFNKEEQVADDKNKKGGKAPPAKKDDKKQAKKGGKDEVEENKEPNPQQVEFKKALNTQKAIFRYRVKVILGYASKRLSQFNSAGLKLYEDLEDLLRYTDKVQNQAAIEMTKIFKQAIEDQRKIENQVQINYTEVLQNHLIRNFEKPKPIILPATEKVESNRFTISSIIQMMKFFSNESEVGKIIKTRRVISVFQKLLVNERYRVILPDTWRNLTIQRLQNFVSKFDQKGKGQIELWTIYTVIALTNVTVATEKDLQDFCLLVTGHNPTIKQVSKETFIKASAWFDSEEPRQQNVRPFERNKYLKQILFDIFKKAEEEEVNLDKMRRQLRLSDYRTGHEEEGITYFDFAFPE